MTGRGTRYERSARFWLRAYPSRWRERHGEEALAVLLDLEPPGATPDGARPGRGIGAREAWGLVRAGWALRRREHPPLGPWLLYRLFDARLPARYWWWVADDIHGALYPWRRAIGTIALVNATQLVLPGLLSLVALFASDAPPGWYGPTFGWWYWFLLAAVAVAGALLFRRSNQERAWRKHVLDGDVPVERQRVVEG